MFRSFLPVEPDEVRASRPETTPPRPRSLVGRLAFTVGVLGALVGVVALFSLLRTPSPCARDAQGVWETIPHFVELEPGDGHRLPGCGAAFDTDASARLVFDHYQSTLKANGWVVAERRDPARPAPLPSPASALSDQPAPITGQGGSLELERDGYRLTIAYDRGWEPRGEPMRWTAVSTVYVVLTSP